MKDKFLILGITVGFAIIFLIMISVIIYDNKIHGSTSEWGKDLKKCTDIWQNTHNETLYYDCMIPLEKVYGAETNPVNTVPQYVKEIKFQTCHTMFDIYNLTSYYKCVGI